MGGRASRQKGMRGEYAVRDYFRSLGFASDRVPSSGAAQGFKGDVVLEKDGRKFKCEVKVRHNEFASIYALPIGSAAYVHYNGASCIISPYFAYLGFGGENTSLYAHIKEPIRTVKKLLGLKKLVKECDFLAIKSDYRPFLFVRFL